MALGKLPSSACSWNTWKHDTTREVRERLGIRGTSIPKSMHGEYNVDGWRVVVKRSAPSRDYQGRPRKSSKHRIFVRSNGDLVPIGRVRQALCRVKVHHSRKRATRTRGPGGRFKSRY